LRRKATALFLVLMISLSSIMVLTPSKLKVKASGETEIPLDNDFMYQILDNLSKIVHRRDPQKNYWQGRNYGTDGEHAAKDILIREWDRHIHSRNESIIDRAKEERIDKHTVLKWSWWDDAIDNNLQIKRKEDYKLVIRNNTTEVVVPYTECFPIPSMRKRVISLNNATVELIPEEVYDLLAIFLGKKSKGEDNADNSSYEIDYVLVNDSGGVAGEVVYIEDYNNVSGNDISGKVHLIEIDINESEEEFNETIQRITELNGTGFIIMVTDPSIIDMKRTAIPGVAISIQDGNKIKMYLENNETVYVETQNDDTVSRTGKLIVSHWKTFQSKQKYIYLLEIDELIERGISQTLFKFSANIFYLCKWIAEIFSDSQPPSAFLIADCNDDTHFMMAATPVSKFARRYRGFLIPNVGAPMMGINKTLASKIKRMKENGIVYADFYINAEFNRSVESYNVIGKINGTSEDNETVIVCAHYDSWWGECAIDNAVGPAIVWGVAKYFADNKITPKYNIKFIAWGGEEYGRRGSQFYVWKHLIKGNEKVRAVINLDSLAQDTKNTGFSIDFTPWMEAHGDDATFRKVWDIMNKTDYEKRTGYRFSSFYEKYDGKRDRRRVCRFTDTASFADVFPGRKLADYIIALERWPYPEIENQDALAYFWHRSGENNTKGDIISKIDKNDMYTIAEITLNLTKFFAVDPSHRFDVCSFTPFDKDGDGKEDSVDITYRVTTDVSSWGTVEARLYDSQGDMVTSVCTPNLITIKKGEITTGHLTITLPATKEPGNYTIRLILIDHMGNCDDIYNETDDENCKVYLYPYSKPIADFHWTPLRPYTNEVVHFYDDSMASYAATIVNWTWDFGDGNVSYEQNPAHEYADNGFYNVTLVIVDSNNLTANITKVMEVRNRNPWAVFSPNVSIACKGDAIKFTSSSYDTDGFIVNWTWNFGDGNVSYEENPTHVYDRSGFYTVQLRVVDDDGAVGIAKRTVSIFDAVVDDDLRDNPSKHRWNTIQEGINGVQDGGMIYVYNGTYNEEILVNKSISMYGEDREGVIITGRNTVITINNATLYMNGFTVRDGDIGILSTCSVRGRSTIENCIIRSTDVGILFDNSSYNAVQNCEISGNDIGIKIINNSIRNIVKQSNISYTNYGVYILNSSYNQIGSPPIYQPYDSDCIFKFNDCSIYLENADNNFIIGCHIDAKPAIAGILLPYTTGIYLRNSNRNLIGTCLIINATDTAIFLDGSSYNKIEHSAVALNNNGILLSSSSNNLIVENCFVNNTSPAVSIYPGSSSNRIYYNDFILNGGGRLPQAYDGARGENNIWSKEGNQTLRIHSSGAGEGNYWSDYDGNDTNGDGIGDTPYIISGPAGSLDNYPLMEPYAWWENW